MFEREENPERVSKADIVVGLPSYNEADSIAYPTKQAALGLKKYFRRYKSVIVNCDNNSPDDTERAFMGTRTTVPKIYITTPQDATGKGHNFENLFGKSYHLGAKALVCLDADLLSITPEWIRSFVQPILDGYDYVAPVYSRHKYDGTITKNICYPLTYGVFGTNVRQPIGGDFAISRSLIEKLLLSSWHRSTVEYGIDIFMTMSAVVSGSKMCETGLGAKVHKPSAPKLGPMFLQVVGTAFQMIIRNEESWRHPMQVKQLPLFGRRELDPAQDLKVDRKAILKNAIKDHKEFGKSLGDILPASLAKKVKRQFATGKMDINSEMWSDIIYNMLISFKRFKRQREAVVAALRGMYFGRVVSFINETWEMSTPEVEKVVREQAELFFAKRDILLKRFPK